MPTMRVKTKFEAKDDVSAVARRIEKNVRAMNRDMQRGFKQSTKSALKFGGVLKANLLSAGIQKGFGLLSQGAGEVTRQFIGFDDAITAAAVRFKDIGPDSKDFTLRLNEIKVAAREAGATTIFTGEQSAKALDFLARAGFTAAEAMGSLRTMINLSIATGSEFARAADISSDLLGAFSLNADNTAEKIKNLNRLNDVLTYTANSANVNLEDMFETMKDIAPIATQNLKMSLEEVAGITAKLGDSGIKGTKAMTAMRGIFLSLAAPTSEGGQILKALQVEVFDKLGNPRKFVDVMGDLRTALNGVSVQSRNIALKGIFGKIPLAGATTFLRDVEKIDLFIKKAMEAGGVSQRSADIMQQSLGNQITKLGSAFVDLGFEILGGEEKFKSFVSSATGRINELAQLLRSFRDEDQRPTGTSAADNRRVLEMLDKGGKTARIPYISGLADFFGTLAFGQTIDEMVSEKAVKDRLRESEAVKEFSKRGLLAALVASASPEFAAERGQNIFRQQFDAVGQAAQVRQPQLNVTVENQINADGVTVDSTVKAPGTSSGPGVNRY
jgi:TP901 family phage tail tape measure protein